ncbi:MAG: type VI secretion system-associated protein TagF [Rhizobiaceae bacterium]
MSDADLILPGFYGKLPAAGDFVTRRLPHDFVLSWDRWLAQHLAPLIGPDHWDYHTPLRFLSGPASFGPAAGVVAASHDRVGRRFPLSIVAVLPEARSNLANRNDWFASLEAAAQAAQDGLPPDELDARLAELGIAVGTGDESDPIDAMTVWTRRSDLYDLDPADPRPTLHQLLAQNVETS